MYTPKRRRLFENERGWLRRFVQGWAMRCGGKVLPRPIEEERNVGTEVELGNKIEIEIEIAQTG